MRYVVLLGHILTERLYPTRLQRSFVPTDLDYKNKRCSDLISFTGIYRSTPAPCLQLSIVLSRELREKGRCSELISRTAQLRKRDWNVC